MPCGNKKILVTGATGLIGKELIVPLKERGFDIYAMTIDKCNRNNNVNWINCNIFNYREVQKVCTEINAKYLLNMAWCTTGDYLTSPINYDFLNAGINLIKSFIQNGGERILLIGTCFEYNFTNKPLKETDSLDTKKTVYTFCKDILHQVAEFYCKSNKVSFAYGRIFYAYGRQENKTRLTGMLINELSNNNLVIIKNSSLLRDYMYSKDIANALVCLLDSNVENSVNICTGQAISIKDFALHIAKKIGKEHLLVLKNKPELQAPLILGDNTKLIKDVGYKIKYSLDMAIDDILNSIYGANR